MSVEFDDLIPNNNSIRFDDLVPEPKNPPTNSLLSGVISRIYGITGDLVEGAARIGEQGGDYLESKFPLSGLTGDRLTPEQLQQRQLEPVFKAAEWLKRKQADINYQPSVDFDQIKQDPLNLPQTGTFILEQGVTSLPDMAASVINLPGYILSRTNDIASERAVNEERTDAVTLGDMAKAAPAAVIESTLERLATGRLLPGKVTGTNAATRVGKQVGLQAGTESVEELAAYTGETAGTRKGFDTSEGLDRAAAGALVGGPIGGVTQSAAEAYNSVANTPERQLARAIEEAAQRVADTQASPQEVRTMFADLIPEANRAESTTPQAASALTVPPVTAPERPRPVLPQPELPAAPELTPAAQTEPPTQPVAEVPPFESPVDQAEQAVQTANELPAPLVLTRGQQITEARPGMRPGDIVSREGRVFTNQAVAKAAAMEAGNGWRVKRANGGFVVRYQPPTEKQIETAKANARRAASIDPTRDSMFAAIAKLGGVNKAQLVSEWGVDPADLKNTFGAGIKRVATSKGRTLDDIAESLSELGYLSKDANGKWDLREFEELFGEELSGSKHFTAEGFESQAQAQQEQAYEDFLTEQDAQESGYNDLPEEAQDLIDEVLNDYEQISAEEEARLEREAIQWADGQPVTSLEEQDADIPFDTSPEAQSDRDPFETDSQASTESGQGERTNDVATELELSGQTPQELRAQQEAKALQAGQRREEERRAQADDMVGDFRLTGSDREIDQAEAAGQTNLLDQLDDETPGRIDDFGEKIGGARKDTAQPTGTRQRTQEQDDTPTWRKRFAVVQNTTSGKHVIFDKRTNKPMREGWRVLEFDTEEAANNMVPLAAVAQKHRVVVDQPGDNPTYKIIRDVTDRKRVTIRDGFPSREQAMQYMAENAVQILETKTGFGEEILSKPETVTRRGAERRQGDVKPKDFSERFGFRGVEFGNWNNQEERQEVMNHAFDGLLDLAELLNVPPKALSLNGDLALAFGARGQGLSGARAHYERNYGVINLTKMSGAGSLAHEWWHALDHYLGRQDGKAPSERVTNERGDKVFGTKGRENDYVSYGFGRQSKVRAELAQAYDALMNTMFTKAEQYVEDTQKAEKFLKATRDALDESLGKLRRNLQAQLDPKYYKRNNKPASEEQLAAFDVLADKLLNGQDLETDFRPSENKNASRFTGRWSNDTLDAMSAIYKSVRGRAGFTSERSGTLDAIANDMRRYKQRIDMLESARAADTKTRRVPTSYAMEAKRIDQGRSSDYWTTPHEMAARAFSSYVEDKLASQQARSDFLSYGSNNNLPEYRLFGVRPFPEGDERATINEAFDRFVSEIRTRETDQGVEIFESRGEYDTVQSKGSTYDPRQLQLFLDSGPVETQAGAEQAQNEAVRAVEDLNASGSLLGLALSSDYAARQRASLVGQEVSSPEDLATLAQVYRDPRFETFRLVFVNDNGTVVSQIGLTSRLPASTAAIAGNDLNAFVQEVSEAAQKVGASGYYMLHNHPSGIPAPSNEDLALTSAYVRAGTLPMKGHVVIDTNKYAVIDAQGNAKEFSKDFGQPEPFTNAGEWGNFKITSPASLMQMTKKLNSEDGVTFIVTDNQLQVKGITTVPMNAIGGNEATNRRVLLRATRTFNGSRVFAVSSDRAKVKTLGQQGLVVDAIHSTEAGAVSLATAGEIRGDADNNLYPSRRRTRITQDTSNEFDFLRSRDSRPQARAADKRTRFSGQQSQSPEFKRWFGDSKVVDTQGKPLVVYHGTQGNFDTFSPEFYGEATGTGDMGDGFYFTDRADVASSFAGSDQGANVLPVYLAIENPATNEVINSPEVQDILDDGMGFVELSEYLAEQGYDGIVYTHREGGVEYVAFQPKQIKSATGNSGAFDPNNPSIVASGKGNYSLNSLQGTAQSWNIPEPTAGDAFVRAIQNNKVDLKRVRDAIAQQYGTIPDDVDAYLGEELYQGKVSARVESIYKDSVEPILAKIAVADKNNGVTLDDVNQYLHARHAPERNAAMKAINPNMQDNEALSGMSDAQARKIMADFKANGKDKALAAIAKDIDQLISDTRTNLVADGLEDAGAVRAWESAYKHYVPLQRDVKGGTPRGMGFSVRGPEAKRAVGSNRKVVNILANIVAQAETAAIRAEKATVGRALLAMARQYPNENFWTVDTPPTKPRIDKDTGLVIRGAVDPLYQTAENVVMVKEYGKEHFIVFNDQNERAMQVATAMKNLGIDKTGRILQVVNRATRFLASLLTQRNPVFWLTNFSRDIQGALINLEGTKAEGMQKQVLKNLPKAFKGMRSVVRGDGRGQWARYAREFQDAGGATGYMQVFENSDERMKDIRKEVSRMQQGKADPRRLGRQILQFIDDYNDVIENAVRLSVFQTAREGGASIKQAASIAKNITVNFNRKGNLTPTVNSLYMFFNASVQGTARLAQAIVTSRTAQVAVGGIAMAGFLLDLVNRAMSDDDEDTGRNRYDLIPEYEKAKNWIVMNPMRPGEYVKIPLPLGPHVFHNAGRLLSDAIFREDPRNAQEYGWAIASTLMDAFSPLGATTSMGQLIAPSVADPVLQLTENQSFMGTSVYKSADRGFGNTDPAPAYTRYFESTPDVWKAASKALNDMSGGDDVKPGSIDVEPDILKHVFYTMTGGPGRTIDQLIDSTQAEARGQETNVNRLPLLSRFYGANDDRQRERIYYDDRKRILDAKTQFDYFNKQGRRDLAREVAEELGEGDYTKGLRKMREFSSTQSVIRKINAQIRQELERQASGEDRTEQLKALKKRRTEFMSGAVRDDE